MAFGGLELAASSVFPTPPVGIKRYLFGTLINLLRMLGGLCHFETIMINLKAWKVFSVSAFVFCAFREADRGGQED